MAWIGSGADVARSLTSQPTTCLNRPLKDVAVGELLFNNPQLLGGQAAKAGLHCGSCHRNGRGNPDFVFLGVSGTPGTADVTHGLFGPDRADDTFNPVVIPDLASAEGRLKVDRNADGDLESFLRAQIVEEFQGAAPTDAVIDEIARYLRALDVDQCVADADEPVTWRREVSRLEAGLQALSHGAIDEATRRAVASAMRNALGRLYGRYDAKAHTPIREQLLDMSYSLADGEDSTALAVELTELTRKLTEHADRSLYDAATLRSALNAQR